MINYGITDTIAAIATPVGEGGIGIVRLSGKEALKICDQIFVCPSGGKPSTFKSYTTHYGFIVNGLAGERVHGFNRLTGIPAHRHTNVIDEVILTIMRSPRSYTREDVVEINCHGGIVALRAVLDLVLTKGSRLAEPGEFTKRAFLNGRIDLTQAEAVLDIIRAKTDTALKIGIGQLKGGLSSQLNKYRESLLDILSGLEAGIDFPEEGFAETDWKIVSQKISAVEQGLQGLTQNSRLARILREGIQVVICGKPNTGKSSLLNALLKEERSIVTPVAGTTRDTIEEIIDIRGIPVRIVDTAGILEPRDLVEKKAVQRSQAQIAGADLALILFDASKRLTKEDLFLIRKLKQKKAICVLNKIDLKPKIERQKLQKLFQEVIAISAKKRTHIGLLENAIAEMVYGGKIVASESLLVANLRYIKMLQKAEKVIAEARKSLDNRLSPEFIAQGLKEALGYLDEILGKKFSEDLLDKIFAEFCIGK